MSRNLGIKYLTFDSLDQIFLRPWLALVKSYMSYEVFWEMYQLTNFVCIKSTVYIRV